MCTKSTYWEQKPVCFPKECHVYISINSKPKRKPCKKTEFIYDPVQAFNDICKAAKEESDKKLHKALQFSCIDVFHVIKNEDGDTEYYSPITYLAEKGLLKAVKFLLDHGANPDRALLGSLKGGYITWDKLLQEGGSPDIAVKGVAEANECELTFITDYFEQKNAHLPSAIHYAARNKRNPNLLGELLNLLKPNDRDEFILEHAMKGAAEGNNAALLESLKKEFSKEKISEANFFSNLFGMKTKLRNKTPPNQLTYLDSEEFKYLHLEEVGKIGDPKYIADVEDFFLQYEGYQINNDLLILKGLVQGGHFELIRQNLNSRWSPEKINLILKTAVKYKRPCIINFILEKYKIPNSPLRSFYIKRQENAILEGAKAGKLLNNIYAFSMLEWFLSQIKHKEIQDIFRKASGNHNLKTKENITIWLFQGGQLMGKTETLDGKETFKPHSFINTSGEETEISLPPEIYLLITSFILGLPENLTEKFSECKRTFFKNCVNNKENMVTKGRKNLKEMAAAMLSKFF